jgi:hypothetical protein
MKSAIFATGMLVASAAAAGSGAWSDTARPLAPGAGRTASVSAPHRGTLEVFTDQVSFDTAVGDPGALASETFDGGATGAGGINTCNEPVNSASNDVCFAPGDLVDGFDLTSTSGGGIIALGAEFLGPGQTSTVVGANTFTDSTIVTFTTPVAAFSADLYDGVGAGEITIEAFDDSSASLGTATATPAGTDAPVFLGIISATPVASITITAAADGGELLDNLRFGEVGGAGDDTIFKDGFDGGPAPVAPTVAKAFAPASIAIDTNSVLTITLDNTNATPATLSADLVDTFPLGLIVADPSDAATTCASGTATGVASGNTVTLSSGAQIPADGSCTVTVSVTSTEAATYTNTISAGSLQTDLGNSPADATADLTVTDGGTCSPTQLLQDPGFEATDNSGFPYTNPNWDGTSTNFGSPFCDSGCGDGGGSAGVHAGTFWAWLGGAGPVPETSTVTQDVVIPAGDTRFLNFWLWIGAIGDGTTNLDVAVDSTVLTSFPEPAAAEAGYTQRGIDVSSFADGNSHTITFTYTSPGSGSANYSLDDVTLDCTPAPLSWPLPSLRPANGSTLRAAH